MYFRAKITLNRNYYYTLKYSQEKNSVKHRLYIKFPITTPTPKINNISSCMYTSFCNGKIPETKR